MLLLLAQEAIEDGRATPDDLVTATRRAQRQGGSQIFLGDGEQATLEKLLEAVAVGSANDAAVAVAVHLYGSADEAVKAMNARAASLGMAHTHYVNVTGLPERGPENHSTARDLSQLARVIVTEVEPVAALEARMDGFDVMPMAEAALIGCGVMTGVGAALYTAQVPGGAEVAVIGCGGIGLNIIQGCRLAGASKIIAIDIVPSKLEMAQRLTRVARVSGGEG